MTRYDDMMQKMTVEEMVSLITQQSCTRCIWENDDCSGKVCEEGVKKWLDMEHKESILDESERQYLSAVIKPFRDHVRYICKGVCKSYSLKKEFQFIKISTGKGVYDSIIMPGFAPDTMYKGMELSKDYTPEELGL